jgi:excisionase family DNA binding protein
MKPSGNPLYTSEPTERLTGPTGMVRPERPHGEKASPKWLAGSPNRTEPVRDQIPGASRNGSTAGQPLVAKRHCHDDRPPIAAGGCEHRSPMSYAKPLPGSGAAEHTRCRMLRGDQSDGDEIIREMNSGIDVPERRTVPRPAHVGAPLLITVEEASELLRLGRTRTYDFIRCGAIQSVKVGRRRLVVRSSLDSFVQSLIAEQGELPA